MKFVRWFLIVFGIWLYGYTCWCVGALHQSKQDNVTLKETVDRDAKTIHNLESELQIVRADDSCSMVVDLDLVNAYKKLKAQRSYLDEYYKRGEVVIQGR